jgi:hypothetical protein
VAVNFPDSPTNGDTFQAGGLQFTYNSTTNSWDSSSDDPTNVTSSDTAPSSANAGDLWFNSSNLQLYVYYSDGSSSQWVKTNPSGSGATHAVAVQNTQPSNPSAGDLWFDTDNVVLYVYYSDGSSNQWVGVSQIGSSGGGSGGGASVSVSDTAPSSPSAGDLWFDSSDATLYVYYNDSSSNQWVSASGPTGATGSINNSKLIALNMFFGG